MRRNLVFMLALVMLLSVFYGGIAIGAEEESGQTVEDAQAKLEETLNDLNEILNGADFDMPALSTMAPIQPDVEPIQPWSGMSSDTPEDSTNADPDVQEENTGSAIDSEVLGTITGNTYVNEYFGIQCDLDDDWGFLTKDEAQAVKDATGITASGSATNIVDMYAFYSDDVERTINAVLVRDPALPYFTEESLVDMYVEAIPSISGEYAEPLGLEITSVEKNKVFFAGQEKVGMKMIGESPEGPCCQQVVYFLRGDYMLQVSLTTWLGEADITNMTACFTMQDDAAVRNDTENDVYINEEYGFMYEPADGWMITSNENSTEAGMDDVLLTASGMFGLCELAVTSEDLPMTMRFTYSGIGRNFEERIADGVAEGIEQGLLAHEEVTSGSVEKMPVEFAGETRWGYSGHYTVDTGDGTEMTSYIQGVCLQNGGSFLNIMIRSDILADQIDVALSQFSAYPQ